MDMRFEEFVNGLSTPQEQADYMAQALRYCAEHVSLSGKNDPKTEELEKELAEVKAQNDELNLRLEKAKEYFRENKNMLGSAEERTKAITARNLQKTRDELYVLGNALHARAVALSEKATAKMTLVEVNNLQSNIAEIIGNLQENGLWNEEQDLKPDLSWVEKAAKPKAPKKSKKKEETSEQLTMADEPVQEHAEE